MPATVATRVRSDQTDNGGQAAIELQRPYRAQITVLGIAPILFHRWDNEVVSEKAAAAKGSKAKYRDNVEGYVYRTAEGYLGVPGNCFTAALQEAARYAVDPRSPRKSLRDLVRATILPLDVVAPFQPRRKQWDFEDRRRVTIQRQAVTRTRPALLEGWSVAFLILVTLPQYISEMVLTKLATDAGMLCGLCDHRPTYGRFVVQGVEVLSDG